MERSSRDKVSLRNCCPFWLVFKIIWQYFICYYERLTKKVWPLLMFF
jgi:hypothetical protein